MVEYVHLPENENIGPEERAYQIEEEFLDYKGRKVLCLKSEAGGGITFCDRSYVQGVSSLFVKGYIVEWKNKNEEGELVSKLEPVKDLTEQQEITEILKAEFQKSDVYF
jgi:hypothetical protein